MFFQTRAHAEWRALTAAALLGSGAGLGLGAVYMAGGLAQQATDHSRAARLAQAAHEGFSEDVLERSAARFDFGVLSVARRHDPLNNSGAEERDRQSALFAARLEQRGQGDASPAARYLLRAALAVEPSFARAPAAAPFRLSGAVEASRDLECLTQAVYFEARGETPAGQAAVAQVVLNRVRSPAFPKTVCGVVYQGAAGRGCQFSFACSGQQRGGYEAGAWRRAQKIAMRALSGYVMAEVGRATHFHTTGVSPGWGPGLARVAQVGAHVFYRFGRGGFTSGPATFEAEPMGPGGFTAQAAQPAEADVRLTSLLLEPAAKVTGQPAEVAPAAPPPPPEPPAAEGRATGAAS